jgi:transcriptional regulator with XRE-family HTH domain
MQDASVQPAIDLSLPPQAMQEANVQPAIDLSLPPQAMQEANVQPAIDLSLPPQAMQEANAQPAIDLIDYASALDGASSPPNDQAPDDQGDMGDGAAIIDPGSNQPAVNANATASVFQSDVSVAAITDALPVASSLPQAGVASYDAGALTVCPCPLSDTQALGSGTAGDRSHDFVNAASAGLTITDRLFTSNQEGGINSSAGQSGGRAWADAIAIQPIVSQSNLAANQGGAGVAPAIVTGPGAAGWDAEDGHAMGTISNDGTMDWNFLVVSHRQLRAHQESEGAKGVAGPAHREGSRAGCSLESWTRGVLRETGFADAAMTTMWDGRVWGRWLVSAPNSLPGSQSIAGARVGPAASRGVKPRPRRARKGVPLAGGHENHFSVATWVMGFALLSVMCERRAQAAALRSQGLSLREIGLRLGGLSRQGIAYLLSTDPSGHAQGVHCSTCAASITERCFRRRTVGDALCRSCLASHPGAPFSLRLRSWRLAAGWSRRELAVAAAVTETRIKAYEDGTAMPHQRTRRQLAKALAATDLEQFAEERDRMTEAARVVNPSPAVRGREYVQRGLSWLQSQR